jgi:sulfur carrier protein ThiS
MRVTVNTKGATGLPAGSTEIELNTDATVEDLLRALFAGRAEAQTSTNPGIPTNLILTHNETYIPVSRFGTQVLSAGDEVSIIPLVVGG